MAGRAKGRRSTGREDEGEAQCSVSEAQEGLCLPRQPRVCSPQVPGQADGRFNFIQIVPMKVL